MLLLHDGEKWAGVQWLANRMVVLTGSLVLRPACGIMFVALFLESAYGINSGGESVSATMKNLNNGS